MRKKKAIGEYVGIADRHIEAAEERIRQQKRRLFDMAGRGEDVSQKVQFLAPRRRAKPSKGLASRIGAAGPGTSLHDFPTFKETHVFRDCLR